MEISLTNHTKIDQDEWDTFIGNSPDGSVFSEYWMISLVCPDGWQALLLREKGELKAVMPLNNQRLVFYQLSRQPLLTKYWGVIVARSRKSQQAEQSSEIIKWQDKILDVAMEHFDVLDHFLSLDNRFTQSYKRDGLSIRPEFSQVLSLEKGMEELRNDYSKSLRKNLRRLEKKAFYLREKTRLDDLIETVVANQEDGRSVLPDRLIPLVRQIAKVAMQRDQGFLLSVYAADGKLAAAGFFIQDHKRTYFLNGYVMPEYRNDNATSLLVDAAIEQSTGDKKEFDFFGSSIPGIEQFFRTFGTESKPYYRILKAKFPYNLIWKI